MKKQNDLNFSNQFILDYANDMIAILNHRYQYEYVNQTYLDITGYSLDEVLGTIPLDKIHREDRAVTMADLTVSLRDGKEIGEWRTKIKDGSYIWIEMRAKKFLDDFDEEKILIISRNITKRKLAENRIKEQNKFLSTVIESLAHPFCVINANNHIIELANSIAMANNSFTHITCHELNHNSKTPCVGNHICPLEIVKQTKKPFIIEHTHHNEYDNPRIYEIHTYPIFDDDGEVIQVIESSFDITERKKIEEKNTILLEKYTSLVKNIPGMVYRGKSDWSTEFISNSEQITGYSLDDFNSLKVNWLDIIYPDDKERVFIEGNRLQSEKSSVISEYRIITNDNSVRWVQDRKLPVFDDKNNFIGVDGIVIDITEQKLGEQRLLKSLAIKLKGEHRSYRM